MTKQIIYETTGRAKEYCPYAIEIYDGCEHKCTYCYNVTSGKRKENDFYEKIKPIPGLLYRLELLAPEYSNINGRILLCFGCDPYQPLDDELQLTRKALEILIKYNVPFQVLTKGGLRAVRDFDLLKQANGLYAVTLLFTNDESRKKWEPNTASIDERVESLKIAHEMGINTWVSIEPPIIPEEALGVINLVEPYVSAYKIGKWNHETDAENIDWKDFGYKVYGKMKEIGKPYLIKADLAKFMSKNCVLNTIPESF